MTAPRRAAEEPTFIEVDPHDAPRRAINRGRRLRLALAPVAVAGALVAVTTAGIGGAGAQTVSTIPQAAHTVGVESIAEVMDVSRNAERAPLTGEVGDAPTRDDELLPDDPGLEAAETETPEETAEPEPTEEAPAQPAEPEPTEEPTPEKDYSALGSDDKAMWTKSSVNLRTGPGTGFDVITSFATGTKVTTTSESADGWQQVNHRGSAGWINARYLNESAPATSASSGSSNSSETTATSADSGSSGSSESSGSNSSGGLDFSSCARAAGAESGLTQRTRNVLRAACNAFPNVGSFGGYRSGGGSYHGSGRAVDVMISGEPGWEVARWARANASELGITEVIYAQKIWTTQRSGEGWRSMSDRGSVSANHYDHVHISVR